MIADSLIKEQDKQTVTEAKLEEYQKFNWKHCWYPVTFVQDLPKNSPYSFSLYDEPFVLFRNPDGQLGCLSDRCSHRAAKLSDGQIIDGKLECLYHGWQFGTEGQCLHIPQLPADAKIPVKACIKSLVTVECQGIVWVWPGDPEVADIDRIPTVDVLDKPGFVYTDYMVDLPHDQTYLIENVLDPAHVSISHHGSQGNRKNAQPLEIEIIESSNERICGRWRGTRNPDEVWKYVDFIPPNLVHNIINLGTRDWCVGLVSYGIPLGKGRCRLLFRAYRNFFTWTAFLKPRWFGHLRWNKILEEDYSVIARQEKQIERLGRNLKEIYLPLKTMDTLVIEYRKWLDNVGPNLPYYEGYSTSKRASVEVLEHEQPVLQDRFLRHTHICSSCNRAYQVANRLKQVFIAVAIGVVAVAMLIDEPSSQKWVAVAAFLMAIALAGGTQTVKTKFERSYKRP